MVTEAGPIVGPGTVGDAGAGLPIPRTLVLTGHFPPSHGGVERFTWELVRRLRSDSLVVVAPRQPGCDEFDRSLPFPVVRRRGYLLSRDLRRIVAEHECAAAWIPAAAPIGLFAPSLRKAGIAQIVASTHGQELGWLRAAPTRGAMRQIASSVDVLTYLTAFTHKALEHLPVRLERLVGGVDPAVFSPGPARPHRPRVVSVGRLVRRKGHDALLQAWPSVLAEQPDALLTIVGRGPYAKALHRIAADQGVQGSVEFRTGLSQEELVATLRDSDVLVTPSRDDRWGLQAEGLGLVTLEGSSVGLPVVVGRSGGSADSLLDGVTGLLCDPTPDSLGEALLQLLGNPEQARAMGARGRAWVRQRWSWEESADRLSSLLARK